ncbi:hypothetical protein DH2020_025180 [Rehmannia glutinosa]|uniref:Acid phosphatase/vanadium-dependent haloperoxidase-related protein n=1 Tax=Rehmannia glutinosa TaxID=99300 RepID=A0ABR0W0D3_REHGL
MPTGTPARMEDVAGAPSINGFSDVCNTHQTNRHGCAPKNAASSPRFKKSSVTVNSLNPRNPNSIWGNYGSPIMKPFSYLIPFFQKVRDIAVKPSKQRWVSVFHDLGFQETEFLQNGAFGTALMSVTATAKVKISPFVATLAANPTFVSGLCAWAVAQSMKVFLNFCVERKWDFKIMFASGGMPSSHSALCTALTTSVAICHGVADSLFPVCLGFSLIVMYDAIGVRRHAGMQAEALECGTLYRGLCWSSTRHSSRLDMLPGVHVSHLIRFLSDMQQLCMILLIFVDE